MKNRTNALAAPLAAVLAAAALITGCEKKEPSVGAGAPASQSQASTPPPPPPVVTLSPSDLDLASNAQFPAEFIPEDAPAARAVAALASAIATGDADALAGMIDRADAAVLTHLRDTGQWTRATADSVVRVVNVEPADTGVRVALAIEDPAGAYLIGWEGAPNRGVWIFRSLPVVSPAAERAADLDGAPLALMDIPTPGPDATDTAPTRPPVEERRGSRRGGGRGLGG